MQHRDLARFTNFTKGLERAMHGREAHIRMLLANLGVDRVGPRMLSRGEQRLDDCEPLRSNRETVLAASCGKFREPAGGVAVVAPLTDQV